MIQFFRRIRQKLLEENRFTKYLLYAIGEILLVVIGILIALQINNWNESRKVANKKVELIKQLEKDVIMDIHYLKELDSVYASWQIQGAHILKALNEKTIDEISAQDEFMVGRGSMNHLSIITKTYNQMKDSGILNKITDNRLSQSIDDYYEYAKIETEKANQDNQEFYRYVLNTSGYEYINLLQRVTSRTNLEHMDWSWLKEPKSERYKKFEARISFHVYAIEVNRKLIGQLLDRTENLVNAIDSQSSDRKI